MGPRCPRRIGPTPARRSRGNRWRATRGAGAGCRRCVPKDGHGAALTGGRQPRRLPRARTGGKRPGPRSRGAARARATASPRCPTASALNRAPGTLPGAVRTVTGTGGAGASGLRPLASAMRSEKRGGEGRRRRQHHEPLPQEGLDEPCGPPPSEDLERCAVCGAERLGQEASREVGLGMAQCHRESHAGCMPKVGWPGWKGSTMEYVDQEVSSAQRALCADIRRAHTAGFRSGRCSLEEPWGMPLAGASLAGPYTPGRAQRGGARCWKRRAMPAGAQSARARAGHTRSPPEAGASARGRPRCTRGNRAAWRPARHNRARGGRAHHGGGHDKGRGAKPPPWSSRPATASPGGRLSGASGTRRASRMALSLQSWITAAITPP
jgi:hypothetical protein